MSRATEAALDSTAAQPAGREVARATAVPLRAARPDALVLEAVCKRWDPALPPVLDGVDLAVERGMVVGICGRNGAGKTTLLRIAAGLIAPDAGGVRLCDFDAEDHRTEFQRRLGFLSAGNTGLYARLKVEHHLEYWARLAYVPRARRAHAIGAALDDFGLHDLCGRRVDRLSMGQRQRLRLALAFLHDPEVVLLDEPRTSLDAEGLALIGDALDRLRARGGAAVVCAPTGEDAGVTFDRTHVVSDGRLEPQ